MWHEPQGTDVIGIVAGLGGIAVAILRRSNDIAYRGQTILGNLLSLPSAAAASRTVKQQGTTTPWR